MELLHDTEDYHSETITCIYLKQFLNIIVYYNMPNISIYLGVATFIHSFISKINSKKKLRV